MDRIKTQATVVSQLLFDPKTADTYKNVLVLTGTIIKEVALLIWLAICSSFVFIAWFGDIAIQSGQKARAWWYSQQTETKDGNEAAAATGKALLDVSQNGAYFLLDKAREQLGLDKVDRPAPTKATKAPAAKPAAKPAAAVADKVATAAKEAKTVVEKKASDAKSAADAAVTENS